jgi:hypothetical protein
LLQEKRLGLAQNWDSQRPTRRSWERRELHRPMAKQQGPPQPKAPRHEYQAQRQEPLLTALEELRAGEQ